MTVLLSLSEAFLCLYFIDAEAVIDKIAVSATIVILNYIILPLIKKFFKWLKLIVKKKQKTPKNDGEIADIIIDKIDILESSIIDTLNESNRRLNDDWWINANRRA